VFSRFGLFNLRGVTKRMPTDGGGPERDEAAKYRSDAKASALLWPRTPTVLERIAAGYEAMKRTQCARIKAPSRGISDGVATLLRVYRSRSFMKTCQAGRRRAPPW
jgi:hypothetical protein